MGLPAVICRSIYLAAPLHDIGRVAVPDHTLLEPGPFDAGEIAEMPAHTVMGKRIPGEDPASPAAMDARALTPA